MRRFHAYRADLSEAVKAHALARHADQHAPLTNSDVVAELDGPWTERPRLSHLRERLHLGHIGHPKGFDRSPRPCVTSARILQDHLVDEVSLDHGERRVRLNLLRREQCDPIIATDQTQPTGNGMVSAVLPVHRNR
jgi:hypothetical protein